MTDYRLLSSGPPSDSVIEGFCDRPLVIGLAGKSGSGKDAAATILAQEHGYTAFAFASLLKEVVGLAFNFSQEQLWGRQKDRVDRRYGRTPRWCLQHFGSAFRAVQDNLWICRLEEEIREWWCVNGLRPVVVSDVRFPDEARAVKKMGGVVWRLEGRAGAAQGIAGHDSETALDGWEGFDAVLDNSGSIADLQIQINRLLSS